jgi:hypothetical protein
LNDAQSNAAALRGGLSFTCKRVALPVSDVRIVRKQSFPGGFLHDNTIGDQPIDEVATLIDFCSGNTNQISLEKECELTEEDVPLLYLLGAPQVI